MEVGDQFETFEKLREAIIAKSKDEFFVPILKNTKKAVGVYLSGSFRCSMSGSYRGGKENAPSMKTQCAWRISFGRLSSNMYHITSMCLDHNHPLDQEGYKFIAPLSHQCSSEDIGKLQSLLSMDISIRKLVEMMGEEGVTVRPSQLHRLAMKRDDEVESLCKLIESDSEWKIVTFCDTSSQQTELNALFVTRVNQLRTFRSCPELLEVDCTYNTNRHKLPLCILIGIDQHMRTFIAGVAIIRRETWDFYAWMFCALLKLSGLDSSCIKTIITDNDAALANSIHAVFGDATKHQLCVYHIIINFRSKFQRSLGKDYESAKSLLWDVIYSQEEANFVENMSLLEIGFPDVHEYISNNWVPLRAKWCWTCIKRNANFGHSTSARVEGIHSSIKLDLTPQMRLDSLVKQLERKFRREQQDRERLDYFSRVLVDHNPPAIFACLCRKVSTFVYWNLMKQLKNGSDMTFQVVPSSDRSESTFRVMDMTVTIVGKKFECSCDEFIQNMLPCVHIVVVCSKLNIPFQQHMIHHRWRYFFGLSALMSEEIEESLGEEIDLRYLFEQPPSEQMMPRTAQEHDATNSILEHLPSTTASEHSQSTPDADVVALLMTLSSLYLGMPKEEATAHISKSISELGERGDSQALELEVLRNCTIPPIHPKGRPVSGKARSNPRIHGERKCTKCHQAGHNRKTCPNAVVSRTQ
jgi:hypothetical protein